MKIEYVSSLALLKGIRVEQYEPADIATAIKDPKNLGFVTDIVNKYLRQKSALVEGRDQLSTLIVEKLKFAPKLDKVKKVVDGKEEIIESWAETEGELIARFRAAVRKGEFKVEGWPTDEAGFEAKLQELADQCGDTDDQGKSLYTPPRFKLDITVPERVKKDKNPPKYAVEAATNIIKNGSQAKWVATFKKESVAFEDFSVKGDDAGNLRRLAWAIKAREDAKAKNEYV